MRMQTGPAPGQRMHSWLVWTGVGEHVNVVLFTVFIWFFLRDQPGPWPYTAIGLTSLNLVLVIGGLYWYAKRWRIEQRWSLQARLGLLQACYALTGLALLVFPLALIGGVVFALVPQRPGDILFGAALYAFAVGEFVHYFVIKLNMRPREWRASWRRRRPTVARFRRELRRAVLAARHGQRDTR